MGAFLDKPVTEKHTHSEESKTMPGVRYAVSSMQGWRVNMEDSHVHKLGLNLANGSQSSPLSDVGLFAVFDGHGGDYIAKNSVDVLVQHFTSFFKANANNKQDPSEFLRQGLMETFLTMDKEMRELPKIKSGEDSSGCTAVAAALTSDAYVIANAGDSRCVVVGENAQIKFASKDHKPDLVSLHMYIYICFYIHVHRIRLLYLVCTNEILLLDNCIRHLIVQMLMKIRFHFFGFELRQSSTSQIQKNYYLILCYSYNIARGNRQNFKGGRLCLNETRER